MQVLDHERGRLHVWLALDNLRGSPMQMLKSWYIFFFQSPLADAVVPMDDYAVIDTLWRDWSPGYTPEPVTLGIVTTHTQGLDASDQDTKVNIRPWPVKGMYLPDGIASFQAGGQDYLITANEGDARADS